MKNKEKNIKEIWDMEKCNIQYNWNFKSRRENVAKTLFRVIMTKNFRSDVRPQIVDLEQQENIQMTSR